MKISGLEMEMDLKSSNSFCKILIVSEINYSCCDVRASDIDKYIIDLLEKNTVTNLFRIPYSAYVGNVPNCTSNNPNYFSKVDTLYKLIQKDKTFSNTNLYSINKYDLLELQFKMNIDNFLSANKFSLIESFNADISILTNTKNEIMSLSTDLFKMIFSENKNAKLDKFLKEAKKQCLSHIARLIDYTESMIKICDEFIKLENGRLSFLKTPDFGGVSIFLYDIEAADKYSRQFRQLLDARNFSDYTFQTFVQTLEFLVTFFSKKFENNIIVASEQFAFNIIYVLHTILEFDIKYISDNYNIDEISKNMKKKARNDIYDVFTKHPKNVSCTYVSK